MMEKSILRLVSLQFISGLPGNEILCFIPFSVAYLLPVCGSALSSFLWVCVDFSVSLSCYYICFRLPLPELIPVWEFYVRLQSFSLSFLKNHWYLPWDLFERWFVLNGSSLLDQHDKFPCVVIWLADHIILRRSCYPPNQTSCDTCGQCRGNWEAYSTVWCWGFDGCKIRLITSHSNHYQASFLQEPRVSVLWMLLWRINSG